MLRINRSGSEFVLGARKLVRHHSERGNQRWDFKRRGWIEAHYGGDPLFSFNVHVHSTDYCPASGVPRFPCELRRCLELQLGEHPHDLHSGNHDIRQYMHDSNRTVPFNRCALCPRTPTSSLASWQDNTPDRATGRWKRSTSTSRLAPSSRCSATSAS